MPKPPDPHLIGQKAPLLGIEPAIGTVNDLIIKVLYPSSRNDDNVWGSSWDMTMNSASSTPHGIENARGHDEKNQNEQHRHHHRGAAFHMRRLRDDGPIPG